MYRDYMFTLYYSWRQHGYDHEILPMWIIEDYGMFGRAYKIAWAMDWSLSCTKRVKNGSFDKTRAKKEPN
jgi:hypothetical protein